MHKITNIYKKSTIIPNRTCNLFICDCKTQGKANYGAGYMISHRGYLPLPDDIK